MRKSLTCSHSIISFRCLFKITKSHHKHSCNMGNYKCINHVLIGRILAIQMSKRNDVGHFISSDFSHSFFHFHFIWTCKDKTLFLFFLQSPVQNTVVCGTTVCVLMIASRWEIVVKIFSWNVQNCVYWLDTLLFYSDQRVVTEYHLIV